MAQPAKYRVALFAVLLTQCTLGVHGNDTIKARDAADQLEAATISRYMTCYGNSTDATEWAVALICIASYDENAQMRRSDVDGCKDVIAVLPCDLGKGMIETALNITNLAINCPVEKVPLIVNDVSHPFQGTISFQRMPTFYACN